MRTEPLANKVSEFCLRLASQQGKTLGLSTDGLKIDKDNFQVMTNPIENHHEFECWIDSLEYEVLVMGVWEPKEEIPCKVQTQLKLT